MRSENWDRRRFAVSRSRSALFGLESMTLLSDLRFLPQLSGAERQVAHDVVVHHVSKKNEQEDQADLDEAFFEGHAEIAPANAFHGKQQNVPAIEDRNRQE